MTSAPGPPPAQPFDGFPLGEPVLYLRALPDTVDLNVACSVENVYDQVLGIIRPVQQMNWAIRAAATTQFVFADARGAPVCHLTYVGERGAVALLAQDPRGGNIGELRQRPGPRTGMPIPMSIGYQGQQLAATVFANSGDPLKNVREPIVDGRGTELAVVERQWRYQGRGKARDDRYFDYKLDCAQPLPGPLPFLLFVSAFGQYLCDRLVVGGPNSALGRRLPGRARGM